mmetsp:Transcript_100330/g.173344  ORF Transcript_100330/g.173344 Transcript_100330/m.173344 type:complete len:102 (-) Transcript_100330:192-497(-)
MSAVVERMQNKALLVFSTGRITRHVVGCGVSPVSCQCLHSITGKVHPTTKNAILTQIYANKFGISRKVDCLTDCLSDYLSVCLSLSLCFSLALTPPTMTVG